MTPLAHTAGAQLGALAMSCVGWTLGAVAMGLVQWRVWLVSGSEAVRSGRAWVGLWRACFDSHTQATPGSGVMHCAYMGLTEAFTPPEVAAGQVLMLLSLVTGLAGNAGAVFSVRNLHFGTEKSASVRAAFAATGALCLSAAAMALAPLLWNLSSVVTNQTIRFPPEFKMPPAPDSQHAGNAIWVGMVAAVLMGVSGVTFCAYRTPVDRRGGGARDNLALESHQHL
ncbi:claudin-34-like [Pungitius pungitius]|uniref:claudin-34-like n=1 Tax=Pungitius pungitius TaxID=134920 RepID=UPI002E0DFCF1